MLNMWTYSSSSLITVTVARKALAFYKEEASVKWIFQWDELSRFHTTVTPKLEKNTLLIFWRFMFFSRGSCCRWLHRSLISKHTSWPTRHVTCTSCLASYWFFFQTGVSVWLISTISSWVLILVVWCPMWQEGRLQRSGLTLYPKITFLLIAN